MVAVRRYWLIERTIDSVNVVRPHCVGGKILSKATRSASSGWVPPLLNSEGNRVDTTVTLHSVRLSCIMAVDVTCNQGRKSRGLTPCQSSPLRASTRGPPASKITPEFLSRVAEIYQAAPEGGRLEAVVAAFSVSERQAWRYISQAKQEGLTND